MKHVSGRNSSVSAPSLKAVSLCQWLTTAEAANYLRVKPRSLLLWVRHGRMQAYALSGTKRHIWRFRQEDLDSALLSHPVVGCMPPTVLSQKRGMT